MFYNLLITMIYLNDLWSLYFHDPQEYNWDISSYKLLCNISSVEDCVEIFINYKDLFYNGMFFIMREHITPRWEDENNMNGGCFSFKVSKMEMYDKFFETTCKILGETIGKNGNFSSNVTGISISPKKNYYIIRLWLKDSKYASCENYNISIPKFSTLMYKNHYTE